MCNGRDWLRGLAFAGIFVTGLFAVVIPSLLRLLFRQELTLRQIGQWVKAGDVAAPITYVVDRLEP